MFDLDVARPETEVTLIRRVAMITGAGWGIGAATALVLLAEQGFRVVVNYRASAPQAAMSPSRAAEVADTAVGKAVSRRQT
jgi:NAD(P)-dependent dehydrogenase (short-subunit alcohol dehydrogenase family)